MENNNVRRSIRRGSLVGPATLVGLGIILLLNNFGTLRWSVWETIFRLWPVLVIGVGLDLLIGHRSIWGSLLALVLTLAVFTGALWLLRTDVGIGTAATTERVRQALQGATQAEVVIAPTVGRLTIEGLQESANLVEGTLMLGTGERLARDFAVKGDEATLSLRSEGTSIGPVVGTWRDRRTWDLSLASDVPLKLEISMDVGQAELNLADLTLSELNISMGVGQTIVTLPDKGKFQAKIYSDIGQTVIIIPTGMEARIVFDTGIAAKQVPSDFRRQDDVYTSPGYGSAQNRVDLEVSQDIGNVTIRRSAVR